MSGIISIDQKKRQVKVKAFELENEILFGYFDKQPEEQRDGLLLKALNIGVLALMEDRLSAFLAKTQSELSVELMSLKMIFDMKQEIFFRSAVKGASAEDEILEFLRRHFRESGIKDSAEPSGTKAGTIPGNKTGDIICSVGDTGKTIVIEVKFDKSYKLGDIQDKDVFIKKADTAWSQILEAKANRDSGLGLIVFDRSLADSGILKAVSDVGFVRGVGFIAVVDSQKNDYKNLAIAYSLARDTAVNAKEYDTSPEILTIIVKRILNDLRRVKGLEARVADIKNSADAMLDELRKGMLSIEFTIRYLEKFIKDGKLTKADLFNYYSAAEVKEKFAALNPKELTE